LFIAILLGGLVSLSPADWSRAADGPVGDGFVDLLPKGELDGWETKGKWVLEKDGTLRLVPRPGGLGLFRHRNYLWTKKHFDDFVLDLEYRIEQGGNSGVFFRASSQRSYLEAQIFDSNGKTRALQDTDAGGLVDLVPPKRNAAKPAGQWNRMVVTCRGKQVQVTLNGQQVVDVDLAEASRAAPPLKGRIGLQDNGDRVWFRNVRIKELD
jgi:hypothetical protein